MTNLQRFLANEPGLSTTGVREELVGLLRDYQEVVEALKTCSSEYNEYLDFKGADGMEQFFDEDAVRQCLSLAQKYEWFKEVV